MTTPPEPAAVKSSRVYAVSVRDLLTSLLLLAGVGLIIAAVTLLTDSGEWGLLTAGLFALTAGVLLDDRSVPEPDPEPPVL